ncbi:MAG: AraC family transcriptional regulator [Bacteroidota bacterium]
MIFEFIKVSAPIEPFIQELWYIDSEGSAEISSQKIIPDGYSEVILHLKDPYRINIDGIWRTQSKYLLAGQITKHFYLENTGSSRMIGIKFKPAGLYYLFGLEMSSLVDKVVELESALGGRALDLVKIANQYGNVQESVEKIQAYLLNCVSRNYEVTKLERAIDLVLHQRGLVSIEELSDVVALSERQFARVFKKSVGLTPKKYCRIVRFAHIFRLIQNADNRWIQIALDSGFFDQSHFIKDFKEFTGEDPSKYLFEEKNMANFFLKK